MSAQTLGAFILAGVLVLALYFFDDLCRIVGELSDASEKENK